MKATQGVSYFTSMAKFYYGRKIKGTELGGTYSRNGIGDKL